ncbi:hypothetical protein SCRM01_051 [Synechococcus phage S-CRM01]|uniref:hypothetical protein n=1 Tax=Synechococcus phage S-CRM01 TaxID=1026955 RepID=UPI000209E35D|nr:hypothetical protein SCRM01_051 [Synechococcus phage S-CRM01]AEC52998.1 hypothetical protein SCRM01_051 [Synechococcus phage S-CRM01]
MDPLQELYQLYEAELQPKVKPKTPVKVKPKVELDEPEGAPPNAIVKGLSKGLDALAADLKGGPTPKETSTAVANPKLQDPNPMVGTPQEKESEVDPDGTPTIGSSPEFVHPEAERNQRTQDAIKQGLSPEDAFAAEYGKEPTPRDADEYAKYLAAYTNDKQKNIPKPDEDSESIFGKDVNDNNLTPEEQELEAEEQRRDAALNSENPEEVALEIQNIEDENYDWNLELDKYKTDSLEDLAKTKEITDRIRKNNDKLFAAVREQLANIPSEANRKSFIQSMIHARTFEGRNNSGKGKNQLGYVDVQNLLANRNRLVEGYGDGSPEAIEKFVRSARSIEVSDDFVAASYEVLPEKFKSALKGKGKVSSDAKFKDIHFLGYDKDGKEKRGQATTNDRARLIWKLYLEQGGVDAYTGLPLNLESIDLEHVRGFNNKDGGIPTDEDYKNREHEKNMVLVASNVNQMKKEMNMEDFVKKHVDVKKDWTEEQYGGDSAMYDRQNQILSESVQFAKSLVQDGVFSKDITPELIKDYFMMDDTKYSQAKNEIIGSGTLTKQQKTRLQTMKSQLGKELISALGLARGTADPSGRRSTSFPVDNYYRGFIYSMVKAGPEEYERYKNGWKAAIAAANESRSKKDATRVLKELGLIDEEILNDRKLGRVFREDYDWTEELAQPILTEELEMWYYDLDYLRTYGRA